MAFHTPPRKTTPKREYINLPDWAQIFHTDYWMIRVHNRNSALRRKHYRRIAKNKLKLIEEGKNPELVRLICRYYYSYAQNNALRVVDAIKNPPLQRALF